MLNSYEEATADFQLQKQGLELLDKYHWVLVSAAVGYLPVIFTIQWAMKNRNPFNLRGLLVLWNLILVVFNLAVQEMGKEVESEKEGRPSYQHWT